MAKAKVRWRQRVFVREVSAATAAVLRDIGEELVEDIKARMTPGVSSPFSEPGIDTGEYVDSIDMKLTKIRVRVGTTKKKFTDDLTGGDIITALSLEFGTQHMEARPHYLPAYDRIKGSIAGRFRNLVK